MKDNPYGDIITRSRPCSKTHAPMSRMQRAAQFAPFAALTGYKEEVKEAARLTSEEMLMEETQLERLNEKIHYLTSGVYKNAEITITYFEPDEKKQGGSYLTETDLLKKIDEYHKELIMNQGKRIKLNRIIDLQGTIFNEIEARYE